MDRTSPATLVEAMNCDAASSKIWEEFVVAIDVVTEAVNEDEFGHWLAVGLKIYQLGSKIEGIKQQTFQVLVYRDISPIWWVPSTSVGILEVCYLLVRLSKERKERKEQKEDQTKADADGVSCRGALWTAEFPRRDPCFSSSSF